MVYKGQSIYKWIRGTLFWDAPVSKLLRCPAASFSPSCQELVALVVLPGALATNENAG